MTISDKNKYDLLAHKIVKSKHAIEDVDFLIKNNMLLLAVNRIYYGAFYIVSALALQYNFTTSKHQQLIGWFNKNFIKENVIDKKHGEFLIRAYENRSTGDYDDFVEFKKEDVSELFCGMKDFFRIIQGLIKNNGKIK